MVSSNISSNLLAYHDYKNTPGDQRFELIDGVLEAMTPAPSFLHQRIVAAITSHLYTALDGKPCTVVASPIDVVFAETEDIEQAQIVLQPDILVICDKTKIMTDGIVGAPDIIFEVLSPSSASKDQLYKRNIYEKFGVKEYWIVHPHDKVVWRYYYDNKFPGYGKPDIFDNKAVAESRILPTITINFEKIFEE